MGHGRHPPGAVQRQSQGLFAEDVLAGFQGGDRDRLVQGVRGGDGDHVDVVAGEEVLPIQVAGVYSGLLPGDFERGRDRLTDRDDSGGAAPLSFLKRGDVAQPRDVATRPDHRTPQYLSHPLPPS